MREVNVYVPIDRSVDQHAWQEAKRLVARGPAMDGLSALQTVERLKNLILSGDPEGQYF